MKSSIALFVFVSVMASAMAADDTGVGCPGNSNNPGNTGGQGNAHQGNVQGNGNAPDEVEEPTRLTPEEADSEDVGIIAQMTGWERADVKAHLDLQHKFSVLLDHLKDDDDFADAEMPQAPGGIPKLFFKNGAPPRVEELLQQFKDENNVQVEVQATKFSMKDQQDRFHRIQAKLRSKKFGGGVGSIARDRIALTVTRPSDDNRVKPTPPGRDNIPLDKIDEVAAEILELEEGSDDLYGVQLDIVDSDEVLVELFNTRGGRRIYDSATSNSCTTAFTIENVFTREKGVLTAGHCHAAGWLYDADWPVTDSALVELQHGNEGTGLWEHYPHGDFAWYDTILGTEEPSYWASPTQLRDVAEVEWWQPVGTWVCKYSRIGRSRTCDQVYQTSVVAFNFFTLYAAEMLSATRRQVLQPGDSGGPISYGRRAQGIITGRMGIDGAQRDIYSPLTGLGQLSWGWLPLMVR